MAKKRKDEFYFGIQSKKHRWQYGKRWGGANAVQDPTELFGSALHAWWDASDSSTLTYDGSNNVSDWVDKSSNAYSWPQALGSEQPLWDGVRKISFDGVDESLKNTADIADFVALTEGAVFVKMGITTSVDALPFSIGAEPVNSQRIHFLYDGSVYTDQMWVLIDPSSGTGYRKRETDTIATGEHQVGFSVSGGVSTTLYRNGVVSNQDTPVGTDTGDFFSGMPGATAFATGKYMQLTTAYTAHDLMQVVVTNRPVTAEEAVSLNTFFNTK